MKRHLRFMGQTQDRSISVRFEFHRLKAVLALRGQHFRDFCQALPVTPRHAHFVLTNARTGSQGLLSAIRQALGDPGWDFATGNTDSLRDERRADV